MNGVWIDGKFVLESTLTERIAELETENEKYRLGMQENYGLPIMLIPFEKLRCELMTSLGDENEP